MHKRIHFFETTDVIAEIPKNHSLTLEESVAIENVLKDRKDYVYCELCTDMVKRDIVNDKTVCGQCGCPIGYIEKYNVRRD